MGVSIFLVAYSLPRSNLKVQTAIPAAFTMLQWYARNHTLACVTPALLVNGKVESIGKAPVVDEIAGFRRG